jgi:hypothetical protein
MQGLTPKDLRHAWRSSNSRELPDDLGRTRLLGSLAKRNTSQKEDG